MIQTNELRIGNWVKVEDACYKVVGVGQIFATLCRDGEYKTFVFPSIEPIPLTDELLEKCGFKDIGDNVFIHNLYFDIYKDKDGYYPYNFHEDVCFGCAIDSLHQLQNVFFSLTGKELEVKL